MEVERPSASYVVDVSFHLTRENWGLLADMVASLDAPSHGTSPFACRYNSRTAFTSIDRKVEETNYGCEVDAGRQAIIDGWAYRRIHVVERNRIQL